MKTVYYRFVDEDGNEYGITSFFGQQDAVNALSDDYNRHKRCRLLYQYDVEIKYITRRDGQRICLRKLPVGPAKSAANRPRRRL